MEIRKIADQNVTIHKFNSVVVGAGAAGMNCAKKLYEYMYQKGITNPQGRIAVVTAGLPLGASRMSCSDRMAPTDRKAVELVWTDFREGEIYQ